jgi:FkbM family methyltransferase
VSLLKRQIQTILKRAGLYYRLKTSHIDDLYRGLVDRNWVRDRDAQINFYRQLMPDLRRGDTVFDIGANEGLKTDLFLRMGARVIAIEPDETNLLILRERFFKLRFTPKRVVVVSKAISNEDGTGLMWIDGPGSAVNTLSPKWADALKGNKARHACGHCGLEFAKHRAVETTTLEHLIAEYGRPRFIKIDVEGCELNVITGLRQPVACLSFEVNLPEFLPEGLECVRRLAALAGSSEFNYSADCQRGLALQRWLGADEFPVVLRSCNETSLEVFCKTRVLA